MPKKLGMVFVVDDSGSMADNDPNALRGSATDIGIAQLPDGAVAAVSRFSDVAQTIFNPAELNPASRAASRQAVGSALESSGGTDYDEAFSEAKHQLDAMQGVDRRAVVFLSDGEPNFSYTADQPIAAAGIPIFTLGFAEAPPAELAGIAQRSGGQSFFVSMKIGVWSSAVSGVVVRARGRGGGGELGRRRRERVADAARRERARAGLGA